MWRRGVGSVESGMAGTSKDLLEIMVAHLGKLVSTFRPPCMDNVDLCTCSMEGEQAFTRLGSFQSAPPSSVGNQLYRATCLFLNSEHATRFVGLKYVGLHTQTGQAAGVENWLPILVVVRTTVW